MNQRIPNPMFNAWLKILCLCALLAAPAAAQVYKWVDEKGVTHYGAKPPPGRKSQEVENKLANPSGAKAGSARESNWKDQESDFQGRRIQAEQATEAEANRKAQAENQRSACFQARDNLSRMRAAPAMYKLNDKGERVFHSDEEREASITRQERVVAARCQ